MASNTAGVLLEGGEMDVEQANMIYIHHNVKNIFLIKKKKNDRPKPKDH